MFCPSCERLMEDNAGYCGHCGMFLNKRSEFLEHISTNFAWICRRSWAGFAAGFVGWIIMFIISRMIGNEISPMMNNLFGGMICGVFLGTVGGIIEESAYKAFWGGILGMVGGALGGIFNIPIANLLEGFKYAFPLSIFITWAIGGAFIGATSGIIERHRKKIFAGVLFGLIGGAIGGLLGSLFYGSMLVEFKLAWFSSRFVEGVSGGLVGATLWFFIGVIEKLYIFNRIEDPHIDKKTCSFCKKHNSLRFWYCINCGHALQVSAPRQKIAVTPFRGIERIVNAFKFLSWLFGVTGVIITPVVFFIFLSQDVFLAAISSIFTVLFSYIMVVLFRSLSDFLVCLMQLSLGQKQEKTIINQI